MASLSFGLKSASPLRRVISCPFPTFYPGYARDVAPRVWSGQGMHVMTPSQLPIPSRSYHTYSGAKTPLFKVQHPNNCIQAANQIAGMMKDIRELKWEEQSWTDWFKSKLYSAREKKSLSSELWADRKGNAPIEALTRLIKEHKAAVLIGENLTIPQGEGGSTYIAYHAIVAFDTVVDASGKTWVFVIDPDDTTSHTNMRSIRGYCDKHAKDLFSLTHSEIIEATGDASALVRRLDARLLLNGMAEREGGDDITTPLPVSGVSVINNQV